MYSPTSGKFSAASVHMRQIACDAVFGTRLVVNNFRAVIAEAIVSSALAPDWSWCSADWAGWDFERHDGLRLEVKQSAARQTWQRSNGRPSTCSFDIKSRKGRYEGADWFAEEGRHADIYVFAHHHVADEAADHCDPSQWHFYIVQTQELPPTQSIGLRGLKTLAEPSTYLALRTRVEEVAECLVRHRSTGIRAE